MEAGEPVLPPHAALLASAGQAQVRVHRRPKVALLATGSELVPPGTKPGPGQIRDSNSYSLSAQLLLHNAEIVSTARTVDDPAELRESVEKSLERADMLLFSGGVSVGEKDYGRTVLKEAGVELLFESVKIKPGKPTVFGVAGERVVFGLPGNPVSTLVTFELFVVPALRRMMGWKQVKRGSVFAAFKAGRTKQGARRQFLPAILTFTSEGADVKLVPFHGSADIMGSSRANALVILHENQAPPGPGERVEVLPLFAEALF